MFGKQIVRNPISRGLVEIGVSAVATSYGQGTFVVSPRRPRCCAVRFPVFRVSFVDVRMYLVPTYDGGGIHYIYIYVNAPSKNLC